MRFPTLPRRACVALALGLCGWLRADPVISEFMAANHGTIADNDGAYSDWIEIYNPDTTPVNLVGWSLTDDPAIKTKWQFPSISLPAGGYLLVWASGEDRRDPTKPLHTNFALNADGEYLGLIKSDGATVASDFAPMYPPQLDDISYGVTQPTAAGETARRGFFRKPTPGARNGGADTLLLLEKVAFSRASGPFTGSFTLTMSGASAGQKIRYVLAPPSATGAAVAEPGPTATEYTGPITISSSTLVRASVYTSDNSRGFPATAHYVRLANSGNARLDTFTSNLPLMVIDTHGSGALVKDNIDHPAWMYTFNRPTSGNTVLTGTPSALSSLTTSVRGSSSAQFPKKSYSMHLDDTLGHSLDVALYGLPAHEHWAIVGPWSYDRTYLHNAFVYALSNKIGRWAPRTQLVELFFNANGGDLDTSDYAGIYVLTDAIRTGSDRVDITSLDPNDISPKKITGGYILKSDLADPDEYSFQMRRGYPSSPFALIVDQPKAADLAQAQKDYIKGYMQSFDDALVSDYTTGWRQRTHLDYVDRSSWVDHHILNVLTENVDAFVRSAYMTKDRGGKLVAGPIWDMDRTMDGGDPRTTRTDVWNGSGAIGESNATDLWNYGWWGMLGQDPEYVQAWIDRWQALRRNEFTAANLTALVDSLASQVGALAAARDAAKWPDNASRFGAWQGEVDNLKSWLTRRVAWIDTQFTAAPTMVAAAGTLTITPAPGTQLAYTTDGVDPRSINGGVANSTRLSATPVTVPDTTNLQARSYRPNFASNVTPASAWSSPVGGPRSSTLTPRPRLFNIASRGFVGTGENVLIAGIVVADTAGKQYLARAAGPALTSLGVSGALAQPVLRILDASNREIASNSAWETSPDIADIPDITTAVGAFPFAKGSRDAVILAKLPYGQYTLQISSANNGTGIALAELYEVDSGIGRTLNLSTRAVVRANSAEGALIGGIVARGPAPKRLLIRAVGPTLASFGVAGALADPVLTLLQGATRIASNDDWGTPAGTTATAAEIAAAASSVGAFPLVNGSRDAALLLTLPTTPAGDYTAQVTGKSTTDGIILLEVYELP